jgi:hypothetical protein
VTERSNLAHGGWADVEALVGKELQRQEGPDAVTVADFRRKLEAIGWDCPLRRPQDHRRRGGAPGRTTPELG